jgi:hypothetical protein
LELILIDGYVCIHKKKRRKSERKKVKNMMGIKLNDKHVGEEKSERGGKLIQFSRPIE